MSNLLAVSEAQRILLAAFTVLGIECISLDNALGRILAETITSPIDLPPFDNSSMDGFAVRAIDVAQADHNRPIELDVVGDIPAGASASVSLHQGDAARVMTGAPLPVGADAVVPVEETDLPLLEAGSAAPPRIKIFRPVVAGENLRRRGQDARAGEILLEKGTLLRSREVALLAMLGMHKLHVYRKPRIAIFATGDELLPVGSSLQPGKIYDSNSYLLAALVRQYHGEPLSKGIIPDREEDIQNCLNQIVAEGVDLILSSGGVSVGAFDYVRAVVEKYGSLDVWRVNMRPGKPIAFGNYRGVPFIGLPGNPVSAFVGFEVFLRPVIAKLCGMTGWSRRMQRVKTVDALISDGRESYLRGFVWQEGETWLARLIGHQGSANLRSLVEANALLLVPSGVKSLPIGSQVTAWFLNDG